MDHWSFGVDLSGFLWHLVSLQRWGVSVTCSQPLWVISLRTIWSHKHHRLKLPECVASLQKAVWKINIRIATWDFLLSLRCSVSSLAPIVCRRTQLAAVFGLQRFYVFSSDKTVSGVSMALSCSRIGLFTALGGNHSALGASFISNILSYSPSFFSKHLIKS